MWIIAISVIGHLFCPTPTTSVPAIVKVPPCPCSDKYTKYLCVYIQEFFLWQSTKNVKAYVYIWDWCKLPNRQTICNYASLHSHCLSIRHWLIISIWVTFLPTVIEAACFPHLVNTKYHHCFSSLPTNGRLKILLQCFLMCIFWLLMKVNFFSELMTILISFLKYLFMSFVHLFYLSKFAFFTLLESAFILSIQI